MPRRRGPQTAVRDIGARRAYPVQSHAKTDLARLAGRTRAVSAAPQNALCEFPRDHAAVRVAPSSRVMAGLLTSLLYALFALLVWGSFLTRPLSPAKTEIVARLMP